MPDLSTNDIKALGRANGLDIPDRYLPEVAEIVNALIESVDELDPPGLDNVEPLPIDPSVLKG